MLNRLNRFYSNMNIDQPTYKEHFKYGKLKLKCALPMKSNQVCPCMSRKLLLLCPFWKTLIAFWLHWLSEDGQTLRETIKGAIGDGFRNIFCYAAWKSLHILIAIIKLSGLNSFIWIYIFSGRCRTKKCSSNQNTRSKHFNCLSCLLVNLCFSIPLRTLFAQTYVIISVFTHAVQTEQEW